ncbi:hypothetical protein KFK09_024321 [Dendrobium nobile]|uniref:Uncharacterized protein n=1 Tax=Dendrobium nobile TaxID=94219 RepID=A0A8T3ADF9_DENNO|nr:hypothetical protein KFK09_024321 [Dendrobium nobile]
MTKQADESKSYRYHRGGSQRRNPRSHCRTRTTALHLFVKNTREEDDCMKLLGYIRRQTPAIMDLHGGDLASPSQFWIRKPLLPHHHCLS